MHHFNSFVQTLKWWKWFLTIAFRTITIIKFFFKKFKKFVSTKFDSMHVKIFQIFSIELKSNEYDCCDNKSIVSQHLCNFFVSMIDQFFSQTQINWFFFQMLNSFCTKNRFSLFNLSFYFRSRENVFHFLEWIFLMMKIFCVAFLFTIY